MRRGSAPSPTDAAYVAFVEAAWQRHLRLAMLLTGDPLRAEELLQDSLVKLYERWRKLAQPDQAHAYLRRILTNGHISARGRLRRERLVAAVPERGYQADPHPDAEPLRRALLALPPRQRAIVVLRHYEDMSERDIAELLGLNVGTVKSQNARGLEKLRQAMRQPTEPGRA